MRHAIGLLYELLPFVKNRIQESDRMNTNISASGKLPFVVAVVFTALAGSANADLIASNASFDLNADDSGGDFLSGSDSGSFGLPQFDPSLGTLDSVILSLSYVLFIEAEATVRPLRIPPYYEFGITAIASGRVDILRGTPLQKIEDPGIDTTENFSGFTSAICEPTVFGCVPIPGAGGQPVTRTVTNAVFPFEAINYSFTTPAELAFFIGLGEVPVEFSLNSFNVVSAVGSIQDELWGSSLASSFSGNVGLTYSFTPTTPSISVPEPGTLALFGIGLFAMGLSRRRRTA